MALAEAYVALAKAVARISPLFEALPVISLALTSMPTALARAWEDATASANTDMLFALETTRVTAYSLFTV
ncbi:MAG: hypothetical protein NTU78_17135, partial [Alphaproteobacteria bacterium]|nr:hypothetical protein [Alphaproteobacteria bacterium]